MLRPSCSRRHLTVGHGAEASVAQPIVDEGEQLVGVLCRKVDLVGHSVESERNRSDVPRHDIAAQFADARLDAKPSRVLL